MLVIFSSFWKATLNYYYISSRTNLHSLNVKKGENPYIQRKRPTGESFSSQIEKAFLAQTFLSWYSACIVINICWTLLKEDKSGSLEGRLQYSRLAAVTLFSTLPPFAMVEWSWSCPCVLNPVRYAKRQMQLVQYLSPIRVESLAVWTGADCFAIRQITSNLSDIGSWLAAASPCQRQSLTTLHANKIFTKS